MMNQVYDYHNLRLTCIGVAQDVTVEIPDEVDEEATACRGYLSAWSRDIS